MEHKQIREWHRLDKVAKALNLMLRDGMNLDGTGWSNIHSAHYFIDTKPNGKFHAYRKKKDWVQCPDEPPK